MSESPKDLDSELVHVVTYKILALGRVQIQTDATADALPMMINRLAGVIDNRAMLTQIQGPLLIERRNLKGELQVREAELKIALDDALLDDDHVRMGSSKEIRLARARQKHKDSRITINMMRRRLASCEGLLEVCAIVDKDLTQAKETLSRQVQVIQMELQLQGRPRLG